MNNDEPRPAQGRDKGVTSTEPLGRQRKRRESVVNKTPIAAKTNRIISDTAPSGYLKKIALQAKIENAQMDDLIRSHVIDPATLRNDDFDQFFATRAEDLLN